MKIKNILNISGILFLMATSFLFAVPSKYKIVNNSIVLKEPKYFIDIGVGVNLLPDIKYQLTAKRILSVYNSNNEILPGSPREILVANTTSSLKNKNQISLSPAIEVGIIDEELYYSIKTALSNGKWESVFSQEEGRKEEYSLLGASILASLNYKFYTYKKLNFFLGSTLGVNIGEYKWNYSIYYEPSSLSSQPSEQENVSKNGSYQNYLIGLNLGLEYRFNRSISVYLENSLLFSNMKSSDNRSISERQDQSEGGGGYVVQERVEEVILGVNYQNNTSIKLRYYF